MAVQLTFDLPSREALGREAFFVAPSNGVALATLDAAGSWPSGKLVLMGPSGSGKTHLAHVWAVEHSAIILPVAELTDADIPMLAAHRFVVVEDADRLAQLDDPRAAGFRIHGVDQPDRG